MAANEFATMLHKNCHRIIVILVYAVLEWILILLLLLNSFFSYLIAKFAQFFGLKQSCTWCARLDHVFDTKIISEKSHFDHVCEAHGAEISKMSYCSSHSRLADSKNLCFHCLSSRPADSGIANSNSSTVAFFTLMSENATEGLEEDRCSCCDEILTRKVHPQPLVLKPSWDFLLEYFQKNKIGLEADLVETKTEFQENGCKEANDDQRAFGKEDKVSKKVEDVEESLNLEVQEWSSSQTTDDALWNLGCNEDDESVYKADMLLQNAELMDSDRFICIELIDTDSAPADSTQMPLISSSEHFEEGREEVQELPVEDHLQGLPVEDHTADTSFTEGSDVERPSRLTEEDDKRREAIDIDDDQAAGVQEPKQFSVEQRLQDRSDESTEIEIEGGVESLKSTIEEQEKALNALYAELEEERKAAAEAAQETMAMITKLQEEKAAMQMEALQYQRMMEEQAEYDQEALQLLNDLMLKREKEKKELEKELEVYRANVSEHEGRRRNGSLMRTASNASSNNSIDLGSDNEYDDTQFGTHQQYNLDDSLEEVRETDVEYIPDISLAEFDEERLSILEELKVLEAKLFNHHTGDGDDVMAKKLLPLLDAAENESADEDSEKEEISNQSAAMTSNLYEGNSKMLMQEEIGHVYERLQALEADKDFLKHCIRSMMKGNQGMGLLQEILQHLRDLKSAELSARNMTDFSLPYATMDGEDREE